MSSSLQINSPVTAQSVMRHQLRAAAYEFLEKCSIYVGHCLDDASLGDDRALVENFSRALSCFRGAAETVRELRSSLQGVEGG